MPPKSSLKGKNSPYGGSFFCGFLAVFVLFFSMTCWIQQKEMKAKVDARTEAQDAQWVLVEAHILRDEASPSFMQPEERVRLLYAPVEGAEGSVRTEELHLHKVATHLDVAQDSLTEQTPVPIFSKRAQPAVWSMDYLTKPMLQERLASMSKRAQVSLTLGILLIALTVQVALRTQRKLKAAQNEPEIEEKTPPVNPFAKQKWWVRLVLPLALFCFSALWVGVLGYGFWPKAMETLQASDYPAVSGKVLDLRGHYAQGRRGKSLTIDHTAVQFEWLGKSYITREQGYGFGKEEFNRARSAGRCTVYVNEAQPERSLLRGPCKISTEAKSNLSMLPIVRFLSLIGANL